jgi:hypothetical protein
MIKRVLILLVVVLLPLTAFGGDVPDRDVVLTSDGTLFTIESVSRDDVPNLRTISQRVLMLTVQKGATSSITAVPASLNGGWNGYPSLALDPQSNTLFIFWQMAVNGFLTSDLLVCSYQNGTWGVPTALDNVSWAMRENLHIALTRRTEATADDGSTTSVPEITVHAVWWQQDGSTEWARYAMLTMENGNVSSIQIKNVSDFLPKPDAPANKPVDNEILRHPVILESAAHDTVDVVYGDVRSGKMHRITVKPIANGRLRIPIGVKDRDLPTPVAMSNAATSISALPSSGDGLALYFANSDSISYLLYKNGAWSPLRSIALNQKLTHDSAVEALRRMLNSD